MFYPHSVFIGVNAQTTITADISKFEPMVPIVVVRWGMLFRIASTVSFVDLALDLRPALGSDANRENAWGGAMTGIAHQAVGSGIQHTLKDGEGVAAFRSGIKGLVLPGEQLVIEVIAASTVGQGFPFIEYEALSGQGPDLFDFTEHLS